MQLLATWNRFELIWLATFLGIGTAITLSSGDTWFNYLVLVTGIFCVVLAAKGHIGTYGFGIINSLAYAWTAYQNGLFGEVGLNLMFYLPMNIVGILMWKKHLSHQVVEMKALAWRLAGTVYLACICSIAVLGYLLSLIQGQNTPYIDASTNVIGIVATLLMVWRYREQWVLYIVLNVLTIVMWYLRWINGSEDGSMMVLMWVAFLFNAFYGFYNWSKRAREAEDSTRAARHLPLKSGAQS